MIMKHGPRIPSRRLFLRLLLAGWALLGIIRMAYFLRRFGEESLQMDFAAFYTAGEALNNGLSPYVNYITRDPPIWDGVDVFQHSRFLYPPLAAALFQPIALLPYAVAKYLWMLLNLISIGCSLFITVKTINFEIDLESMLILVAFSITFHPLLALLERGQIDGLTLLMVTLAIGLMVTRNSSHADVVAGFLWGMATLIKLHCVYIVPFLLVRRRWAVAGGYALGLSGIALLSLIMSPYLSLEYLQKELPRIARFGEGGTEAMKLPAEVIQARRAWLPEGYTQKDGVVYRVESLRAISNASLARGLGAALRRIGLELHLSVLSALIFLGFFTGIWRWQICRRLPSRLEILGEGMYWQNALVLILLSAPLTWVMNTVWLLPIAASILCAYAASRDRTSDAGRDLALILGALGLLMAWAPDFIPSLLMGTQLAQAKYLISEALVVVSLILMIETGLNRTIDCHGQANAPAFPQP
ncbi:glycosyltransferase family 87 protein [Thermoflexus sp.]|uniref:glycosyltransferase family 87 protein n=1 Tax=Thermoflexus sp. TaxID=1969742 RepID=UPI0035E41D90